MLEALNHWDERLFLFLNGLHSPFWDAVMWWATDKMSWILLYVALIAYLLFAWRWRAVVIVLGALLLIAVSDQASVHLFKEVFERLRPCHQPELADRVHLVNGYCSGRYGFVSSHASNYFALACFTALWIRRWWYWAGILLWAGFISYSRIYLGVHYPADILAGALFGGLLGWGMYAAMHRLPFEDRRRRPRSAC